MGRFGLPRGVEPHSRPQAESSRVVPLLGSRAAGVATRGLPRGAREVPAGEALGEPGVQRVRDGCLLLPSLGGLRSHWDLHDRIFGLGTEMTKVLCAVAEGPSHRMAGANGGNQP